MLDFLVISVIVGLIVIAIWLYLSTEKEEAKLNVNAFALPKTSLKTHLVLLPTKSKLLLQKIIEIVWCFGIPTLLLAVIALVGYFALTTKNYIYLLIPLSIVIWWCWRIIKLWKNRLRPPFLGLPGMPCYPSAPDIGIDAPSRMIKYNGSAYIPLKVYEGDSYNIKIDLRSSVRQPLSDESSIRFQRMKGSNDVSLNLNIPRHSDRQEFLELEILAAGFSIEGDKKQRQILTADSLRYQWNCFFENSGNHNFAIAFRVVSDSGTSEIGRIEQTIRVVKIDHLTQRQVWTWATIAGIISGGLAILEVLRTLGFW